MPEDNKPWLFFLIAQLKPIPQHITIPFTVRFLSLLFHIANFIKFFPQTFVEVCLIIFALQTYYS